MTRVAHAPSTARTLGVDLASQPERTAVCVIAWSDAHGRVEHLPTTPRERRALTDARLCALIAGEVTGLEGVERAAIDAPFGWPVAFIDALAQSRSGPSWPLGLGEDRSRLARRETDRIVTETLGLPLTTGGRARRAKRPLSVSADKLAIPAMRCAALLAALASRGVDVDRAGSGCVAEVYPDAALRQWDLWPVDWDRQNVGYKGRKAGVAERRAELAQRLRTALVDIVEITEDQQEACARSDDVLDALVCAVLARLVACGLTVPPPAAQQQSARIEGWIHLPVPDSLERLRRAGDRP